MSASEELDRPVSGAPLPAVDFFAKMSTTKNTISDAFMAEAVDVGQSCISADLAGRLKARQSMLASSATRADAKPKTAPSASTPPRSRAVSERSVSGQHDPDDDSSGYASDSSSACSSSVGDRLMSDEFYTFLPGAEAGVDAATHKQRVRNGIAPDGTYAIVAVVAEDPEADGKRRRRKKRHTQEVQRHVPLWAAKRFQRSQGYVRTNDVVALHQEVTDLYDYLRPTEAEIAMRRLVERQICDIATGRWPQCEPCAYGSIATHLLLPTSDLDMSILNVPGNVEDALSDMCSDIAAAKIGVTAYPQMILKTKVPLLKFATRLGGVEVDVSVNAGDGKRNSEMVGEMVAQYPESKPLIVVVKYFLEQRGMNEPFRGGLGSFATTLLVLSFLQHHPIYTTHCERRHCYGLGKLLVDFFRYYSTCFNFERVGISLADDGVLFARNTSRGGPRGNTQHGRPQVVVEDPGNPDNNAASSLRTFQNVASVFEAAYMALTADWPATTVPPHEVDPTRVHPAAPLLQDRPTLLSRIFHSDPGLVARRERMAAGLHDLQQQHTAEEIDRMVGAKRALDRPLLVLPVTPRLDGKPLDFVPRPAPRSVPPPPPMPGQDRRPPQQYGGLPQSGPSYQQRQTPPPQQRDLRPPQQYRNDRPQYDRPQYDRPQYDRPQYGNAQGQGQGYQQRQTPPPQQHRGPPQGRGQYDQPQGRGQCDQPQGRGQYDQPRRRAPKRQERESSDSDGPDMMGWQGNMRSGGRGRYR